MRKKGLQFHIYADDTRIYMPFTPNIDCISFPISRIEECIKDIDEWMLKNSLKLNGGKTEILIIDTNKQCKKLSNISIDVEGSVIEASDKARNLGALFDTNLTLKSHVNVLCKSARYHVDNISFAGRYFTKAWVVGKVEVHIRLIIIVVKNRNCQAYLVCSLFFILSVVPSI